MCQLWRLRFHTHSGSLRHCHVGTRTQNMCTLYLHSNLCTPAPRPSWTVCHHTDDPPCCPHNSQRTHIAEPLVSVRPVCGRRLQWSRTCSPAPTAPTTKRKLVGAARADPSFGSTLLSTAINEEAEEDEDDEDDEREDHVEEVPFSNQSHQPFRASVV